MTKQNSIIWILLMILTASAGIASSAGLAYLVPIILVFAALKFIAVAFGFMEMYQANPFWKTLLVGFVTVFFGIIIIFLQG